MSTLHTVSDLLSEIISQSADDITPSFRLEAPAVTPIDVAKLAIALEQAFGIPLYDEKIARWRTVHDACTHVDALIEEGLAESTERTEDDRTAWFYE